MNDDLQTHFTQVFESLLDNPQHLTGSNLWFPLLLELIANHPAEATLYLQRFTPTQSLREEADYVFELSRRFDGDLLNSRNHIVEDREVALSFTPHERFTVASHMATSYRNFTFESGSVQLILEMEGLPVHYGVELIGVTGEPTPPTVITYGVLRQRADGVSAVRNQKLIRQLVDIAADLFVGRLFDGWTRPCVECGTYCARHWEIHRNTTFHSQFCVCAIEDTSTFMTTPHCFVEPTPRDTCCELML